MAPFVKGVNENGGVCMRKVFTWPSVLLLVLSVAACQAPSGHAVTGASAGFNPLAPIGKQEWTVDGVPKRIDATYYLDLPAGFQFTIEVPVDRVYRDQTAAMKAAWPYIRYAYTRKTYLRTAVTKDGSAPMIPARIGVALVFHQGSHTSGDRVAMTVAEIKARLENP